MITTKVGLSGKITIQLYDKDGALVEVSTNHNIIVDKGDAYMADILSISPTRTKITTGSCYIPVGTGWTGVSTKTNGWVNTLVGSPQAIDATYPKVKGTWGLTDDNILVFRATYLPGSLNVIGLNEAAITSHSTNVAANSTLAYAQISPAINVTLADTLVITWEIEFLGS